MTTSHAAPVVPPVRLAPAVSGALRMRAHARLGTERRIGAHGPYTHIARLRSDPPLSLRRSNPKGPEPGAAHQPGVVRLSLTAAAAGPVGGDRYQLEVHVGAGTAVVLAEVSATLLLPSHDAAQSRTDITIRVDADATLIWLPEPVIAAHRCDHVNNLQVDLAGTARLFLREELLSGRHHEPPGRLQQQVRVRRDGQPVYSQDLDLSSSAWITPGVAGNYAAVGSVLVVDPAWQNHHPAPISLSGQAAVMPLAAPAILVSAVGADSMDLRQLLAAGQTALGPPWAQART